MVQKSTQSRHGSCADPPAYIAARDLRTLIWPLVIKFRQLQILSGHHHSRKSTRQNAGQAFSNGCLLRQKLDVGRDSCDNLER